MLGKEEIVSPSLDELKEHYHRILTLLGEDAGREGLQKTPERVAKSHVVVDERVSYGPARGTPFSQVSRRIQSDGDCERH